MTNQVNTYLQERMLHMLLQEAIPWSMRLWITFVLLEEVRSYMHSCWVLEAYIFPAGLLFVDCHEILHRPKITETLSLTTNELNCLHYCYCRFTYITSMLINLYAKEESGFSLVLRIEKWKNNKDNWSLIVLLFSDHNSLNLFCTVTLFTVTFCSVLN